MQYVGAVSKMTELYWFASKASIQYHNNPSRCPDYYCWRSWSQTVQWRQDLLELRHTKKMFFHHRRLECKSKKSRDTWSNREVWPWSTKWSRAKANRVLPKECFGHNKNPLPTSWEMTLHMDITRWSVLKSHWLYSSQLKMEKLYTVSKNKTESWLWLR